MRLSKIDLKKSYWIFFYPKPFYELYWVEAAIFIFKPQVAHAPALYCIVVLVHCNSFIIINLLVNSSIELEG